MAGGANATSRKRKEKMLREGLTELFKKNPNMICQKKEIILPHHSVKPVIVRMNGRQPAGKRKPNRLLSPPKITLIEDLQTIVNSCLNTNNNTNGLLQKL